MPEPIGSMAALQPTSTPIVAHVIMQAVLVCNCDAHLVLLLNITGGEVECGACKRKWRMQSIEYSVELIESPEGPQDRGKIQFQLAELTRRIEAPSIVLPGSPKWGPQ